MKMFLITWFLLCFFAIVGVFIAYATDRLPGVPASQSLSPSPDKSGQVGVSQSNDQSQTPTRTEISDENHTD